MAKAPVKTRRPGKPLGKGSFAHHCAACVPAKCCLYFSTEIDEPEGLADFDDILWMLAHRDVEVYTHDRRWYVLVRNECRFYDARRGCVIYESRPRICREHPRGDCELEDDYDFELHFRSYEELERFARSAFAKKRAARSRSTRRVR